MKIVLLVCSLGFVACVSPETKDYKTRLANLPSRISRASLYEDFPPINEDIGGDIEWMLGGITVGTEYYAITDHHDLRGSVRYHRAPAEALDPRAFLRGSIDPVRGPLDIFTDLKIVERERGIPAK